MLEQEMIMETLKHYVEGWFEGDPIRMEKALHPQLAKRHFHDNQVDELSYEDMIEYTKKGYGKDNKPEEGTIQINILSVDNNLATAKLDTIFTDFVHLIKTEDGWRIINVIWEYK